jgi:hypothetical protein
LSGAYARLETEAARPGRVVDHAAAWAQLTPIGHADLQTRALIEAFCERKRITFESLDMLGTRFRVRKGGAVELAWGFPSGARQGGGRAITALKYRPIGDGQRYAAKPSRFLETLVIGDPGSLDWFLAEGETDTCRIWDLVGQDCAVMLLPAGARTFRREWADRIPRGATVHLCHDADGEGDAGAGKAALLIGARAVRVRPPDGAKDWCEWAGDRDAFVRHVAQARAVTSTRERRAVSGEDFTSAEEERPRALLGTTDNNVLPAGGLMLDYGDGGAGKTTRVVDGVAHAAAGIPWLGIPIERPLRILVLENEGPRAMFRHKLRQKAQAWEGPSWLPNVVVVEEPWARFTFTDEGDRRWLRELLIEQQIDLVVMGPVLRLGVQGGGTPAEVSAFVELLEEVRTGVDGPPAYWLVHHENKSGDVSGAWEGATDTTVHIQARGNGRTHIVWKKVRWDSQRHGTSQTLRWASGDSFEIEAAGSRDLLAEIPPALDGTGWKTASEIAMIVGANKDAVKEAAEKLTAQGLLEYQQGPPERSSTAKCWRLAGGSETPSHPEPPHLQLVESGRGGSGGSALEGATR